MQEAIEEKLWGVCVSTGRFTQRLLAAAIKSAYRSLKNDKYNDNIFGDEKTKKYGEVKIADLQSDGKKVEEVTLDKEEFKKLESICRKYGIKYSVIKEPGEIIDEPIPVSDRENEPQITEPAGESGEEREVGGGGTRTQETEQTLNEKKDLIENPTPDRSEPQRRREPQRQREPQRDRERYRERDSAYVPQEQKGAKKKALDKYHVFFKAENSAQMDLAMDEIVRSTLKKQNQKRKKETHREIKKDLKETAKLERQQKKSENLERRLERAEEKSRKYNERQQGKDVARSKTPDLGRGAGR